jgi:glycine dehydrogenase subunit 1
MAERLTRRRRVLVARSVHPEYRQVLATYARNIDLQIEEIGFTSSGQIDLEALGASINNEIGAVLVQSPNFFGVLEPVPRIAQIARGAEALTIVAEADIVALETQSFGMAPSYGGPYAGVIATREKYVRQMPGRLAGQTTDAQGRRGFCLTLATREQHIRRERATSNICTNQALCALAATVHLCLLGKQGLREMAEQNVAKAQFALAELEKLPGVRRAFQGPVFNEFVVRFPRSVRMINAQLLRDKIIGPLPLGAHYPELTKCGLVCVTETTRREAIERLADAVRETLAVPV